MTAPAKQIGCDCCRLPPPTPRPPLTVIAAPTIEQGYAAARQVGLSPQGRHVVYAIPWRGRLDGIALSEADTVVYAPGFRPGVTLLTHLRVAAARGYVQLRELEVFLT